HIAEEDPHVGVGLHLERRLLVLTEPASDEDLLHGDAVGGEVVTVGEAATAPTREWSEDRALRGEGPGGGGEGGFQGGGVEDSAHTGLRARLVERAEDPAHPRASQGHVADVHRRGCHQMSLSAARPPFLITTPPTSMVSSAF